MGATPRIWRVSGGRPAGPALAEAADALRRGDLVVVPTETVYGLAADPRAAGAVERIFGAKGRAQDKPVTLLASGLEQVRAHGASMSAAAERLARAFWPGPLTLVLRTPGGFRGFRVPNHEVALALLERVGGVLAVTSANRSGEEPAVTARQAAAALAGHVALVLDGGRSPGGVPSTVVKVDGGKIEILRAGAIPEREIWEMVDG